MEGGKVPRRLYLRPPAGAPRGRRRGGGRRGPDRGRPLRSTGGAKGALVTHGVALVSRKGYTHAAVGWSIGDRGSGGPQNRGRSVLCRERGPGRGPRCWYSLRLRRRPVGARRGCQSEYAVVDSRIVGRKPKTLPRPPTASPQLMFAFLVEYHCFLWVFDNQRITPREG